MRRRCLQHTLTVACSNGCKEGIWVTLMMGGLRGNGSAEKEIPLGRK
jgi:hypothetical protein